MNTSLNKTCSGFINCNHPFKKKQISETSYILAHPLKMWDFIRYDAYSLIETSSGIPVTQKDSNFTIEWKERFNAKTPITHYTFWAVESESGNFVSDKKYNHLTTKGKYVITTKDETGIKCLQYSQSSGLLNWVNLETNIEGLPFDETIVWRILLSDKNKVKNIKEGDNILLVSETNLEKIVTKKISGCDFNENPLFTLSNKEEISAFANKFHGKGVHEESVPVCKYSDCQDDCTLLEFQILGVNLSNNESVTQQVSDNIDIDNSLNTTTNLKIGTFSTGMTVLSLLLLLFIVFLYYFFIPKEYDIISKISFNDMYYNIKDLLTF